MDILNLPYLKALHVKETDTGYYITAEAVARPSLCPHCGALSPQLTGHGRKKQTFQDMLIHGKRVEILVDRRRYICQECGSTFLEQLVDMDEKRNVTKRLLHYIQSKSITNTFTSVAREIGLDEKTIRLIFKDHVTEKLKLYRPEAPKWLCIDEACLIHGYRCVLTNIEALTLLDILNNRKKSTILNYLSQLPKKERVEYVCMDMWQPYRDAANYYLPGAKIIIDKYHVLRCASDAVDAVRKSIGEELPPKERKVLMNGRFILLKSYQSLNPEERLNLECWMCNLPLLKLAYELKEEFYDIFDTSSNKAEAEERYDQWVPRINPDLKKFVNTLITLMATWREEIFNYFDTVTDYPLTNTYNESMKGLIKILNQTGRGYSFNVLRAKMLLAAPEKVQSKHQKDNFICNGMLESINYQTNILGIHIPTLLQKLASSDNRLKNTLYSD